MKSNTNTKPIRSRRPLNLCIAALLGSIALAACGQMDAELAGGMEVDDNAGDFDGTGGNTSTGGGPGDPIHVPPEQGSAPAMDPLSTLCGAGTCVVGSVDANAECGETEACQLIPAEGTAIGECGPVGKSAEGFVCMSAADCQAGMGCAATPNGGGVCKSYCCGEPEACPTKTYCAAQPMAEDPENVAIPVCIPATNCPLLVKDACTNGLTCAIVRDDGTTSCVPPGEGQLNEACPCAYGFVCSKFFNQCKKLCHIGKDLEDCGEF